MSITKKKQPYDHNLFRTEENDQSVYVEKGSHKERLRRGRESGGRSIGAHAEVWLSDSDGEASRGISRMLGTREVQWLLQTYLGKT